MLMHEMAGDNYPTTRPNLYPSTSPYIKKYFEGILMHEIAGGFINKIFNYADPSISRIHDVTFF